VRFTCDKCSAKYTIADEKVRGKIVAVKCSKCGNKITVNGKTLVVPEEIPEERTRVASLTDLDALRAQEAQAASAPAPAKAAPPPPPPPPPPKAAPAAPADDGPAFSEGWHAIIDRQQIGPLTPAELGKHLASGKLSVRTYVWRDGQGDWKRASDVPEFAAALAPKPAAPPPAPAPAPAPAPVPASARSSVSMRRPAPKNGTPAAAVEAKPPSEDFEVEDRPTVQRSDLDVAALAKMAGEGDSPADGGASSDGATLFDPSVGAEEAALAAAEPKLDAAPANLFDDPAQEPDAAASAASDPEQGFQDPPQSDSAPKGDLKSMLFDDDANDPVTGSHSRPIDLANEVAGDLDKKADPFSKVPDNPNISKPGEIGEQTRFFMNKAGVTRRNPPWKIALFVVLVIGLPVAVLYALSLYNVGFLQIQTGVDDSGNEVKASVFTTEGISSLRDVLLKKKPAAPPKPTPKPKNPNPNPNPNPTGSGDGKKPDPSGDPVVAKPDIKFDTLTDEQRKAMADATKETGGNSPKVDPKLLEDKLHVVDGKAGLEPAMVAEVFAKNIKAFQACVETELRRNPAFKGGKVIIGFTIGPSGVVTKASLDRGDLEGTELGICLKKRARTMVFPSFEGEPFDVESPLIMAKGM
jgi:predicted Zn finger-like uncharacterized protein